MHESAEEIQKLQALLDRSNQQAGTFLRESFEIPDHSLNARQLIQSWQGVQTVAFATMTKNGEPRVAPTGVLLWHGRFYIPTIEAAARTRHILRQPAISFTYYQGNDLAVIVHGEAIVIRPDSAQFAAIEAFQRETTRHSVQDWGEGVFLQIIPRTIYTYVRYPEQYQESGATG